MSDEQPLDVNDWNNFVKYATENIKHGINARFKVLPPEYQSVLIDNLVTWLQSVKDGLTRQEDVK